MFEFLSPTIPISRSFFLIPRITGELVGCWPKSQRSWLDVGAFCISAFFLSISSGGEVLYGFMKIEDLQNALEGFCPAISKAVCILKLVLFFIYTKSFYKTMLELKEMLTNETTIGKSKEIQKFAAVASLLSFLLLVFGLATSIFFCLCPLITGAYSVWNGGDFHLVLPFKMLLPSAFKKMPLYPLTFSGLTITAIVTSSTFTAVDGFFVSACMYINAIFDNIQMDIRNYFSDLKECEHASSSQNIKHHRGLSSIVVRHNAIIDLCSEFTSQFTIIIMMTFFPAAMALCLSSLNLMLQFGTVNMFIYLFYSVAALMQLFVYCIGGNRVGESSLQVANTLYDIEWYKCDSRTKKMVLMMLQRSQKAKSIAVPFFTPTLSAFTSILSTAGSYITLFKTFL